VSFNSTLSAFFAYSHDIRRVIYTTITVVLFGISINAIFLGIIGEYIARIYSQVTSSGELTMVEESVGE